MEFIKNYRGPLIFLFLLTGLQIGRFYFPAINPEVDGFLSIAQRILFITGIAWMAIRSVSVARDYLSRRYDTNHEDNLRARKIVTQIRVVRQVVNVIIVMIALANILMSFEGIRQFGVSLLASAGVAGVVLGFAAQKSIANVFAGLQIAITQPIRLDDVVIVEGEWGRIEEITLTYVVVKIWDERRLVVPIAHFIDRPFQNWTRVSSEILGTVFLYLDYSVPLTDLRSELKRIVGEHPNWDGRVCGLQVTNSTNTTMEVRALVSAKDAGKAWDLRCDVREGLLCYLQEHHPHALPKFRIEKTSETYLPM